MIAFSLFSRKSEVGGSNPALVNFSFIQKKSNFCLHCIPMKKNPLHTIQEEEQHLNKQEFLNLL